jgi:hypothetical protein
MKVRRSVREVMLLHSDPRYVPWHKNQYVKEQIEVNLFHIGLLMRVVLQPDGAGNEREAMPPS